MGPLSLSSNRVVHIGNLNAQQSALIHRHIEMRTSTAIDHLDPSFAQPLSSCQFSRDAYVLLYDLPHNLRLLRRRHLAVRSDVDGSLCT